MARLAAAIVSVLAILAAAVGAAAPAVAENFTFYRDAHRDGPWKGPACDDPKVLGRIASHFDQAEAAYWHTGIRMAHITEARESAFRDWDPLIIATRYCTGSAYLTDGRNYGLVYWLRSEQSFAGVSWGVQFCLLGRDRDFAYAPACKMLRPL